MRDAERTCSSGIPAAAVHAGAGRSRRRTCQVHLWESVCARNSTVVGPAIARQVELASTVMSPPTKSAIRARRARRGPPPRCHVEAGEPLEDGLGRVPSSWTPAARGQVQNDGRFRRVTCGTRVASTIGQSAGVLPRQICLRRALLRRRCRRCRSRPPRSRGSTTGSRRWRSPPGDASAKSIAAQCFAYRCGRLVGRNPAGGGCGVEDDTLLRGSVIRHRPRSDLTMCA